MRKRSILIAAVSILTLVVIAGCTRGTQTEEQSYDIAEQVKTLIIDGRAAAITIEAGDGPVQVTETYHFSNDRPRTSHQVSGTDLRLTESGCTTDELRCGVEFHVRLPAATAVNITTAAGAVDLISLAGDVTVRTEAGAVEGTGLAADNVSVSTEAGAMSLAFTRPPRSVTASTELGAISVKLPVGTTYAVEASTTAGGSDVGVQQDAASPYKISLRTTVGAIRVENA